MIRLAARHRPVSRAGWPMRGVWTDLRDGPVALLVLCMVLVAAPSGTKPLWDLESSWRLVLNRAHRLGLHFGSDLEYTYGPWGFLDFPMAVSRANLVLAVVFSVAVTALAWMAIWAAVRAWSPTEGRRRSWVATVVATVVVLVDAPLGGHGALLVLGAGILGALFVGVRGRERHRWVPAFVAASAALSLQIKFSEGVVLAVVAALSALFAPARRLRRMAEVIVTFVVAVLGAWVVIGGRVGDLPTWLLDSARIALGYADAMSFETHPNVLSYLLIVAASVTTVVLVVRNVRTAPTSPRARDWRRGVGVGLIVLALGFFGFKQGVVRRSNGFEPYFYLMLVPAAVLLVARTRRTFHSFVPIALVGLLAWNTGAFVSPDLHQVRARLGDTAELIGSSTSQQEYLSSARTDIRKTFNVPKRMQTLIGNHPVNVDGWAASLPWGDRMNWYPMPVFQGYVAYTEDLDKLNAAALRDAPGQLRILRYPEFSIDTRNSLWDPPTYNTEELCRTSVEAAAAYWLLLRKAPQRCGPARVVSTEQVRAGERVEVPSATAHQLVTMSFTPEISLGARIVSALYKPTSQLVFRVDRTHEYRVPRALATGALAMNAPGAAGWPARFQSDAPYRVIEPNESGVLSFSIRSYR